MSLIFLKIHLSSENKKGKKMLYLVKRILTIEFCDDCLL